MKTPDAVHPLPQGGEGCRFNTAPLSTPNSSLSPQGARAVDSRSGCSLIWLRQSSRVFDPLTRPAPADENAGCSPPSPQGGEGCRFNTAPLSTPNSSLSPQGARAVDSRSGCSLIWLRRSSRVFDPLTRPAPADDNAGCSPPSPPGGEGCRFNTAPLSTPNSSLSPQGARAVDSRSGCSLIWLRQDSRVFDPLTRPAPADENAGCSPPSPPRGRGLSFNTVPLSTPNSSLSPKGAREVDSQLCCSQS